MMKVLLNRIRPFSAKPSSSSSIRHFCTAITDEHAEVAATTRKGGRKIGPVLYKRLSTLGLTGGSAADTLNQYFSEGNLARKYELDSCIWELRKFGKLNHALQVMEWMQTRNIKFNSADHAKYLDLISKVQGISAADNYFLGLPESAKDNSTYGALLNCYCREKSIDEAQALFEKMDKMHFVSSLAFTNLMSLYMRRNLPDVVPNLVREMKNRNIPLTVHTYNIWMTSYSQLNDIEGLERVFEEMKVSNGEEQHDWTTFSNLAVAYVKAELYEKAELTLKKLEEEIGKMGKRCSREPYHYMISLYAGTSNLGEVHRIWKLLKSSFVSTTNASTLIMVESLARLDDINGFKEIFENWESTCSTYDFRLAKTAIGFYVKHGMITEAENVFDHILKRCKGSSYQSCNPLISHYLENNQVDLALKCLEASLSEVKDNKWHPTLEVVVNRFMEYFKRQSDVNGAEKFCKILKKVDHLDSEAYKLLLETYVATSKTELEMRQRIMDDGIEISCELEELLGRVCPK